ncbi:hypothetical protein O181_005228 [Austropuccinia psidii MF-1]|uniref:Uncharacterized protein n=1 Tax=Austropuccinia psidii MF-1 TaxID=1389203 RepID=A0A9Q3BHV7_9BASI|nr:hypothetical protein [Austropuccinia psidii MF-1]
MEEKQPSTIQASAENSPSSQPQQFQCKKAAKSSEQRKRQGTRHKTFQPRLQNPKDSEGCHGKCIPDGQNNEAALKAFVDMIMAEANQLQKDKGQAERTTRSLIGHKKSQPEGLQKCISAQRVPDPCRSVEKLHEFLGDCEKVPWPSQNLQVTQWMASIDGKEVHDAFNSRMEEKQCSTTQESSKNSPSSQQQQFQLKKSSQKLRTKEKARHQTQNLPARVTESQRFSRMPWKMYSRWPEQ